MRGSMTTFIVLIFLNTFQVTTTLGQGYTDAVILVLTSGRDFGTYTGEILKAEGFNQFETRSVDSLESLSAELQRFDLVILSSAALSGQQALVVSEFVKGGGNIIAFRPDRKLASVFGVDFKERDTGNLLVSVNASTSIGKGIITQRFRIHSKVDLAAAKAATTVAAVHADRSSSAIGAAVVWNKYGAGQAVAFMYNLPENIVLTRQGNPDYAGKETDGITGIRAMDLFTNGWVDTLDNRLNHADEQMRLLTHAIEYLTASRKPIPRLWYFPGELKSLVTLNNDGEDSKETEFEPQFVDVHAKGAKMTLYIKEVDLVSRAFTDKWQQRGFEISGHPDHTKEATQPRWNAMDSIYKSLNAKLKSAYDVKSMQTVTNHWFVWCGNYDNGTPDFAAQAKLEEINGVGLDCNYAHYDNFSNQGHFLGALGWNQGNYTGSGLAMKFTDGKGNTIDVYQQLNNVYDQQYMENKDQEGYYHCFKGLLDRSMDNEVYSYISVRAHNNEYFFSKEPLMKMLDYANARGIPVWTELMLLKFLRSRENVTFEKMNWSNNVLSFNFRSPVKADHEVTCMLPYTFSGNNIKAVTVDGKRRTVKPVVIKGYQYVLVPVKAGGNYRITARYNP